MPETPHGKSHRKEGSDARTEETAAKETGRTIPERAVRIGQSAADVALSRVQEVRDRTQDRFEEQASRAASTLERLSRAFEFASDEIKSDNERVARYLDGAGDGMRRVADYLSSATPSGVGGDLAKLARQRPALVAGGSFLAGVLMGRFLHATQKSDSKDLSRDPRSAQRPLKPGQPENAPPRALRQSN